MNDTKKIIFNPKDKLNALIGFLVAESPIDEEWREIETDEGLYFCSSKGRVLSLCRNIPRELKQSIHDNGYKYITLNNKAQRLNRVIAKAFIPNPCGLPVCDHIDGNKLNNSMDNLQWLSYSDNTKKYWKSKKEKREQLAADTESIGF